MPHPAGIDNPWRRLPWVVLTALMIWGGLLWGLGILLGQMAEEPELRNPLEAQFLELTPPAKHRAVAEPPRPKWRRQATPQAMRPAEQAATQVPSQREPVVEPAVQAPVQPAPTVALPEANLPAGNKVTADPVQPVFAAHAKSAPNGSQGTITAPQFGAAYLHNPKPGYPATAKRMGLEGTAMLKVLVSRNGDALEVEIAQSSGHEILDKSAVEAVRSWRFVPAKHGDSPVEEWVQVPVAFHLRK